MAAFEPVPANLDLLRRSIAENGFVARVRLFPAVVAEASGETDLMSLDVRCAFNSGGSYIAKAAAPTPREHQRLRVAKVKLDELELPRPVAFVKIDAEGARGLALAGAEELLARDRPTVLAELNPHQLLEVSGMSAEELIRWMAELGYECRRLEGGRLRRRIRSTESLVNVAFLPQRRKADPKQRLGEREQTSLEPVLRRGKCAVLPSDSRTLACYCPAVFPRVGPRRWLVLAVLYLPLVFTGALVARYVVDVPIQDEWSLVEDIGKASAGEWGLQDLVRSHNGHRWAIARLILVGLALATDWRADLPQYLGVAFAAGILVFAWMALRRSSDLVTAVAAAAFLGGLVASPNQWENWLWGVQMHVFLVVLFGMASLALLSSGPIEWKRLAGAGALALAACLTQGAGLVLWPAGMLVLIARGIQARERKSYAFAAVWAATGALVVVGYLAHLPGDAGAGEPSAWVFRHPLAALKFVAALLGHSLAAWNGAAYPPRDGGMAGVAAVLALAVALPLARRALRGPLPGAAIFPLALMVWSLGVSAQIAIGRASWGQEGALASRYVTLMLPFWMGLALLLLGSSVTWRRQALVGLSVLLACSAASEVRMFPDRYRLFVPARRALLTGEDRNLLSRLHPEVFQVDAGVPTLRRLKLSVFREGEPVPIATSLPLVDPRQLVASETPPKALAPGSRRTLKVTVKNAGTEGWSSTGDGVSRGWVAFAARWRGAGGEILAEGPHVRLPKDLPPGESIERRLPVVAPDVPAGLYSLEVSALQEGNFWFPLPARFEVEVRR